MTDEQSLMSAGQSIIMRHGRKPDDDFVRDVSADLIENGFRNPVVRFEDDGGPSVYFEISDTRATFGGIAAPLRKMLLDGKRVGGFVEPGWYVATED